MAGWRWRNVGLRRGRITIAPEIGALHAAPVMLPTGTATAQRRHRTRHDHDRRGDWVAARVGPPSLARPSEDTRLRAGRQLAAVPDHPAPSAPAGQGEPVRVHRPAWRADVAQHLQPPRSAAGRGRRRPPLDHSGAPRADLPRATALAQDLADRRPHPRDRPGAAARASPVQPDRRGLQPCSARGRTALLRGLERRWKHAHSARAARSPRSDSSIMPWLAVTGRSLASSDAESALRSRARAGRSR